MDCDAIFINFEIHWYTHLRHYFLNTSSLLITSKDSGGINLGVFFVPNTPKSIQLIRDMYNLRWIIDRQFWLKDQSALKQLMKKDASIESRLNFVPQRLLNAYLDNEAGASWEPYHFIMHQVFCTDLDGCVANFTNVVKRVMP
jgi:hypothetical protein